MREEEGAEEGAGAGEEEEDEPFPEASTPAVAEEVTVDVIRDVNVDP